MKTKITKIIILSLVAVLAASSLMISSTYAMADAARRGPCTPQTEQAPLGAQSTVANDPLTEEEITGLQDAILEEYTAMNTYLAIAETLEEDLPFTRIARSEQQHVNALIRLAERYGVEVPENPGDVAEIPYSNYSEACQLGVEFEQIDADLYDTLMEFTTNPDLIRVYTRLQSASLNNHLPAFDACN